MGLSGSVLRVSSTFLVELVFADKVTDIIMVKEVKTNHNFGDRP